MECLLGGLADLSFPERSRTRMLLLTSEVGFDLYKELEEKCSVRVVAILINIRLDLCPAKILGNCTLTLHQTITCLALKPYSAYMRFEKLMDSFPRDC
jgi:hypothetical protein